MNHTTPWQRTHGKPFLPVTLVTKADLDAITRVDLLTPLERSHYAAKPLHQQLSWCLGRLAAKRAVTRLMPNTASVTYQDITITNHQNGVPVCASWTVPSTPTPKLSISHTNDIAVAMAWPDSSEAKVGVDIERIRFFTPEMSRAFMTPAEYRTYLTTGVGTRQGFATWLWSLKESYLKAIHQGLRTHPKNITFDLSSISDTSEKMTLFHNKTPITAQVYWTPHQEFYIITSVSV